MAAIFKYIDEHDDVRAYEDAFACIRNLSGDERDLGLSKLLRSKIFRGFQKGLDLYELNKRVLCYEAPEDFDSFMLYLESGRPYENQFWLPRRKILKPVADALQALEKGDMKELFLSLPPRVGKSTLVMFFTLWAMGRDTERTNLYCSFSEKTVDPFYNGVMEVLTDQVTYRWYDVFPGGTIASTNAKDGLINLGRRRRFASLTCRPIGGSLNGSCDANGYIIGDDLCSGIEEALSRDRMNSLWTIVDNNFITRALPSAKRIWMGTRWSIYDPAGIRMDLLRNDPAYEDWKWQDINIPAIGTDGESNFDYDYRKGFTTDDYMQRRASFERRGDMASWFAQYQGEPIEREGEVFAPDSLRYYNGVLPTDPDRIFMVVDPAWGGGDFVAAPVVYQYGEDLYVADVVFNNGDKKITQPMIANKVKTHNVAAMKVEGTKMTAAYGEDIDKALRSEGIRINMQINVKHFTGMGKRDRIVDKSPDIRERMVFLSPDHRSKEYEQFMQQVFAFTYTGKTKHDDAPDALAMAIEYANHGINRVTVLQSPFKV